LPITDFTVDESLIRGFMMVYSPGFGTNTIMAERRRDVDTVAQVLSFYFK
jgi:hypothetical protein